MSTCISRRACADRESFKLINSNGQLGKYIWTEYKCPNVVSDDIPFRIQRGVFCDWGVKIEEGRQATVGTPTGE